MVLARQLCEAYVYLTHWMYFVRECSVGHARYLVDGLTAARAAGVMGEVCTELETTEAELFQATVVPLLSKAAGDEQAPVCWGHCRHSCTAPANAALLTDRRRGLQPWTWRVRSSWRMGASTRHVGNRLREYCR